MKQNLISHLIYRLFLIILLFSLLFANSGLDNALASSVEEIPERPSSLLPNDVCMIDGTVEISSQGISAVKSALARAVDVVDFHNAECFAPIDLRDEGDWQLITLIGLVGVQPDVEWTVLSHGVWSDLALIHSEGKTVTAAVAGTGEFSALLAKFPENIISQEAKRALDPLAPIQAKASQDAGTTAFQGYTFPFQNGTFVKFFRFHWDTSDNFTWWTGANSKAVDLGSDGNTVAKHAPNGLLAVASGTVIHRCNAESSYPSTYLHVLNDDGVNVIYAHILKLDAPKVGDRISQGQFLGVLRTGFFDDDTCGYGRQDPSEFHVHFEVTNTASLTLGDWTLSTSTGLWTRGNETWSPGQYKQVGVGNNSPVLTLNFGSSLSNRPVAVELLYTNALFHQMLGPAFTGTAITDGNGNISNFSLTGVAPGTYSLLVKPRGWLRKQKFVTLGSGPQIFPIDFRSAFDFQSGGDINGNNKVDIFDYNLLVTDFGRTNPRSDITGNGVVDIFDYNALLGGFSFVGYGGEIVTNGSSFAGSPAVVPTGELSLVPLTNTAQVGDVITIDLDFDTAGLEMAAVDAIIDYDQCVLEPIIDQITESDVLQTTATLAIPGTLEYQAHRWTVINPGPSVSGAGNLASIPFRVIAGLSSSTKVSIRFRLNSTYLSNLDRDDTIEPFLGTVNNAVLHPTGFPQRPIQSAQIISPSSGETISQNVILLQAQALDACNGIQQVTFSVFYDGEWHALTPDHDASNGWSVYWDASQVSDQVIQVKAFAGDFAGNGVETPVSSNITLYRPSASFEDVQTVHWAYSYIERLYASGITGGCATGPLQYCPESSVTRAQMAVFLLKGIHGSSYVPPAVGNSTGFSDVQPTHWASAWIKQLAVDNITGGCASGRYCPNSPVTRAQMAIFLLKAKYGASYTPPTVGVSTGFSDVPPDHWAAAWIKQLAAEGITGGCGTGTYCPDTPVTRAQMAVFLVRTFNLP